MSKKCLIHSQLHGLTSARVVLPHESQEDYDRLQASLVRRFTPYDEMERALVHQMASSLWRLNRIEEMEAALFHIAFGQQQELLGPDADPQEVRIAAYAEVAESRGLRMLSRHQGQLRRAYEKAWKELEILQQRRSQEPTDDFEACEQNEPTRSISARMVHDFFNAPMPVITDEMRAMASGGHV